MLPEGLCTIPCIFNEQQFYSVPQKVQLFPCHNDSFTNSCTVHSFIHLLPTTFAHVDVQPILTYQKTWLDPPASEKRSPLSNQNILLLPLRHGGPPPRALHQSGLTTRKAFMASRSSPKTASILHKFHTQGAEHTALMHHRPGEGQSAQQECRGKLSAMG